MSVQSNVLRVGVLVDTKSIPNWAYEMLRLVNTTEYAKIVLIVENDATGLAERTLWQLARRKFNRFIYSVYERAERFLFLVEPDAFALQNILELLPNVPSIKVLPIQTTFSDYITDKDVATIESYNVDVLIRIGFRILRGNILNAARSGVWSYHHGDSRLNRGGPAGFWEVFHRLPETGSILQILSEDLDAGKVLYRSSSQTDHFSVRRNRNKVYWKSSAFLLRKLEQLHRLGTEKFKALVEEENRDPLFYSNRLYAAPSNLKMIKLLLQHIYYFAREKLQRLFYFDQWMLLYDFSSTTNISTSIWRFQHIIPTKDRFWADPFTISRNGKFYVFIEEFIYKLNKGHIAYFILEENGKLTKPLKILDRPYHLSYPFIFEYEGHTFMIPESAQNRSVELYRCIEFPERWEFMRVLIKDVYAVDSTLHFSNGLWWLFTNIKVHEGGSSLDELFIYFSSNPLSDLWTSHPCNPVISDVKSARPAGRIFELNGHLYRPAQDNSRRYGNGIRIKRIEKLSPLEYKEVLISEINPTWDPKIIGVHTLNFTGKLTIMDGLKRRRKFPN
jgi:hypothetical protein